MIQVVANIKPGDRFVLPCAYEPSSGERSLVGIDISCRVMTAMRKHVAWLEVRVVDAEAGLFELDLGDTRGWPEKKQLFVDIRYTSSQGAWSEATDTFAINVGESVTPLGQPQ